MSSITLEGLKEWMDALETTANRLTYLGDKIKEESDIPQLKDQLLTLPEKIKASQIDALNKKNGLGVVEQQMKQREAEIMVEINYEKGENGKAKFSNDPTRKSELTKRLGKDKLYQSLKKEHSEIEFKVWEQEAEADKLRREFQALLAHKDLIVAELNLYTK